MKLIQGVVTLITTPIQPKNNYVLANAPSLQVYVHEILWSKENAKCIVENFYRDKEERTLPINSLKRLIVLNEDYCFLPTKEQIIAFQLWKEIGRECDFPAFENDSVGFETYPGLVL